MTRPRRRTWSASPPVAEPRQQTRPRSRSLARPLAAAAVVGAMLPVTAGPARAEAPAYSGFSTTTTASPLRVEIYEPTIPFPSDPQAELDFGYTAVESDSGSSTGRASWLWPGDTLGEGWKTVIENLGFPPEMSGPLAEGGYPAQVNSSSPSGESSEKDEPFPGMVMRTEAGSERTNAETGYSSDCEVQPPDGHADEPPGLPPLPGLPGAPAAAGVSGPADADRSTAKRDRTQDGEGCPFPAELAALVDVGGYVSTSSATNRGDRVVTDSRSAVSDVRLLGGVITVSDAHARSLAASDGDRGRPDGTTGYGTLAIAGQEFTIGPRGVEAAGQRQQIPGLPDDPARALAELGVSIVAPKPAYSREGDQAGSSVAALRVEIDTHQLRSKLDGLPLDDIVDAVPDQAGELKSLLGAAVHLSPRIVITLGDARSAVDTVQGIPIPTTPPTAGGDGGGNGAGSVTTAGAGGAAAAPPAAAGAPGGAAPPAADGTLDDAAPMGAGLPPLGSVPGALLYGGVGLAAFAGTWLRRIGLLALGGAGSCTHGLDQGLPDLRKA